ncbi:LysR family transcriptional regulator [Lactiplantibacillus mudanjiangensis]|uniref:LysR substrate binding domain protein [Lactobacillus reuteri] n=1 Tax=Lactiplantibacillus mudanjiangensis TaxID=1296538 RepID=A0A660E1Y8_9LACO|nr:LysR family transcriptional regulator [Lactiplantibacillus mudanjiangensis]VDG25549.1 LysR substrate binding domain protein [Lactobacillus reuteri] [Lactiplantibacillus mudanjiangensis]VDG28142.1 LysR substrate binding domain protein [Lactobacillus reuteri] [Lactiplantibacillus mudanjiangensis]VDG30964.1 LysR substrate binding domain protein [Lactobacillus reuteri] [Lactiplantibacillus mudanjiangensis]
MNLHQLRIFYTVAQCQSVGQAAKKLYISQPAVSQQLKQFESQYQVKLLQPQGRGIALTPLGTKVYEQAKLIFEQEAYLETILTAATPPLRLGGTALALEQLLSQSTVTWSRLKISRLNTQTLIDQMALQQLDLAVLPQAVTDPNYQRFALQPDQWIFVAAEGDPVTTVTRSQLVDLPLIIREVGSTTHQLLVDILGTRQLNQAIEVNDQATAIQLAKQQLGIYFCAAASVQAAIQAHDLKQVVVTDYQPQVRQLYLYERHAMAGSLIDQHLRQTLAL